MTRPDVPVSRIRCGRVLLLSILLVVAACAGPDAAKSTVPPEPQALAGIWLAEFRGVVLQFRVDQGPAQDLTGVLDSPMEGVTDLPTTITADGANVIIEIPVAAVVIEATVEADSLAGIWKHRGAEVPISFTRQAEPFTTRPNSGAAASLPVRIR